MYTVEILVCKKIRDRVGIFYGIVLQIRTEQGLVWSYTPTHNIDFLRNPPLRIKSVGVLFSLLNPILTLNEISVQNVFPCVIIGSCSSVLPSQQSNSKQRQPANKACLYISTDDFPVSWWPNKNLNTAVRKNSSVLLQKRYLFLWVYKLVFYFSEQ